jgi:hypothetical protein
MVSNRNRFNYMLIIIGLILMITASNFVSCVLPAEPFIDEFKMSIASGQDTISPYANIKICFTERLKDTSAAFQFDPPFFSFISIVNKGRDTISIILANPLPGDTCFVLHPVKAIKSESGQEINISDSISFHVYPTEHEPNDNIATADILEKKIYGSIATVNDTDFFAIPASANVIYLKSFSSQTTFKIKDSNGKFSSDRPDTLTSDTLTIPDNLIAPLFLAVISLKKSVGGYYETGYITKK